MTRSQLGWFAAALLALAPAGAQAQISDDLVKIGVLTDLSGPASDPTGEGSVAAAARVLGVSNVTLQFNLARNLDSAAQDVQAAIARATPRLPADLPNPPSYRKLNPADAPTLLLSLSSPSMPLHEALLASQRSGTGDHDSAGPRIHSTAPQA